MRTVPGILIQSYMKIRTVRSYQWVFPPYPNKSHRLLTLKISLVLILHERHIRAMNFLLHRYEYPYSTWVCARGVEKKWEEAFAIYNLDRFGNFQLGSRFRHKVTSHEVCVVFRYFWISHRKCSIVPSLSRWVEPTAPFQGNNP